jgi:hypothetical protein
MMNAFHVHQARSDLRRLEKVFVMVLCTAITSACGGSGGSGGDGGGSGGGSGGSATGDGSSVGPVAASASGIPTRESIAGKPVVGRITAKPGQVIEDQHVVSDSGPASTSQTGLPA